MQGSSARVLSPHLDKKKNSGHQETTSSPSFCSCLQLFHHLLLLFIFSSSSFKYVTNGFWIFFVQLRIAVSRRRIHQYKKLSLIDNAVAALRAEVQKEVPALRVPSS
jgi:hypothetical protein